MRNKQSGFSLIELLIVVAIILIIAAIAIPNLIRARISANESSAVSSIHAVTTAEITYASTFPGIGYSVSLSDLGNGGTSPCPGTATAACFLDTLLSTPPYNKSGYKFTYVQDSSSTPSPGFSINADPIVQDVTGQRGFYSDQTNVIRANSTGAANSTSLPL